MRSDRSLSNRLNEFALDDDSAQFKFSDRLARENGWSLAFAKTAIGEYKKFVYLAAISPTPVTPSDIVDQVWHLHLTYSRSYWDEMCRDVLGKPLHHGPTKGGASENDKYRDCYIATLAAYRREFGEEPPCAFWPLPDTRFDGASHQRWVDRRTHAVIAWRSIARSAAIGVSAILLTSAGAAFAAASAHADHGKLYTDLGILGAVAVAVAFYLASRFVRRGGKNDKDGGGYSCSAGTSGGRSSGNSGQHGSVGSHGGNDVSGGHGGDGGGGSDGGGSGCSSGCGGGGCSSG